MKNISVDGDNVIDWGKTSVDYSKWRPNYPDRFFDALRLYDVGLRGQRILDLGTGVGFLALRFAQSGAEVIGIDISREQIDEAKRRAASLGVSADFRIARAEETGLPSLSYDVITASQSWLYFDKDRAIPEVHRLLKPGGVFVTSHFGWLPRVDPIAHASEQLVLQHNPKWSAGDLSGEVSFKPRWAERHFTVKAMFAFNEAIPFTRESWRGRIRACRGIGATLSAQQIEAFDREHEVLLNTIAPESFSVLHWIDAHIFEPIRQE
jgi:SAM-dependent methyltransferase